MELSEYIRQEMVMDSGDVLREHVDQWKDEFRMDGDLNIYLMGNRDTATEEIVAFLVAIQYRHHIDDDYDPHATVSEISDHLGIHQNTVSARLCEIDSVTRVERGVYEATPSDITSL